MKMLSGKNKQPYSSLFFTRNSNLQHSHAFTITMGGQACRFDIGNPKSARTHTCKKVVVRNFRTTTDNKTYFWKDVL